MLNTSGEAQDCALDALRGTCLVLSTHLDRESERCERRLALRADEAVILVTVGTILATQDRSLPSKAE